MISLTVTLQDHRHTRESWGVATVLIVEARVGSHIDATKGMTRDESELLEHGCFPGVEVTVVGDRIGLAAPGERLELRGTFEPSKFGQQFRVVEQISKGIREPEDAARWLERLDGVGPKLAKELAKHFGERLPEILAGTVEADLSEVHGVGEETARHIRESFAELAISGDLETIRYLDGIRASRYEATKIITWCARKRRPPIEVLKSSPYDLMDIKGLGFKRVDRLARAAGCLATAPARIEAATTHQLADIVQRGSTMVPLLASRFGGLVGEVTEELGLDDRAHVMAAIRRLAAGGTVVLADDERGRTWVHCAKLLRAEREIYRAAKGGNVRGSLGALPNQATVKRGPPSPLPAQTVNGGECQGGEPRGEGVSAPVTTPAALPRTLEDDLESVKGKGLGATFAVLCARDPHAGRGWGDE